MPVVTTQDITIQVDPATGVASITPEMVLDTMSDDCSEVSIVGVTPNTDLECGDNTVVLTVVDECGNEGSANAIVTVNCFDISLVKEVSNPIPNVGEVVTFTVTVSNDITIDATGVSVADVLPNGYANPTNISNGGSASGNTVTWSALTIPGSGNVALTFDVEVLAPGAGVEYLNVAEVTAMDQVDVDSTPGNDDGDQSEDDEDSAIVDPQLADVSLIKEVSEATPNVGDVVTFTITVSNAGPNDATNVSVADVIPNGYANFTNISGGGALAGNVITWTGMNIAVGANEVLTFDAEVLAPGAGVDYLNIAEVTAMDQTDIDSTPGNDDGDQSEDDEDNAEIEPQLADVSLLKEVSELTPNVGDVITFTITVTNDGPSDATNVSVADVIPNGYANFTNISGGGALAGNVITWTGMNIATGANEVLTFDAEVLAPGAGVDYLNIAEVTAMDQTDSDSAPGNDDGDQSEDDEDSAEIEPQLADVSLLKEVSELTPNVGDVITFTITVTNDGPSDATNVSVADMIPNGYANFTNISGGGALAGNVITWTGMNIAVGANEVLTFDAEVLAPGAGVDYLNIAEVTAMDQTDSDSAPGNDDGDQSEDDEDSAEIEPQLADVSLLKEVSELTPNVGDVITFTITVTNDGPSDATNVSVADMIPNGYVNFTNISGGGALAGNVITWTGMNIPTGANEVLTFDAEVLAPGAGVDYLNIAEVTAMDQTDSDSAPGNDDGDQSEDDEDSAEIEPQLADVSLLKEVSELTPNVGDVITFTITVTNDGPSDATNVAVADMIPNGYANFTNISGGGALAGNVITWTGMNIATGANEVLTFDAEVLAPGAGVDYLNIAEVTAMDQTDSDSAPGNDDGDQSEDDEDNATIEPQLADVSLTKVVSNTTPNVGDVVTFTITVDNAGPSEATGIAVMDNLPTGYTNITNISSGGTTMGNTVLWNGLNVCSRWEVKY